MNHLETSLPDEMRFNTVLQDLRETLVDDITDLQADLNEIIDPISEFSRDAEQLWQLSACLALIMKSETENAHEVRIVMYRAMCFALQLVDDLKSGPIDSLPVTSFLPTDCDSTVDQSILDQTSTYLSDRAGIDNILSTFMPEIDNTYLYHHHAETAAALMFMLSERQQAEIILQNHLRKLSPEDLC